MINQSNKITGTVKWYSEEKGYGFISSEIVDEDVFLHHSAIQNNDDIRFFAGDRVTFKVEKQKKGLAAKNAERLIKKNLQNK